MNKELAKLINRVGQLGFQSKDISMMNVHMNERESVVATVTPTWAIIKKDYFNPDTHEARETLLTIELQGLSWAGEKITIINGEIEKEDLILKHFIKEADKLITEAEQY